MTVHPSGFVVPVWALLIALELWLAPLTLRERIVAVGLVIWALAASSRLLDGARWERRYQLVGVVALLAFGSWSDTPRGLDDC